MHDLPEVRALLHRAADIVETRGLAKETFYDEGRVCMLAAIYEARWGRRPGFLAYALLQAFSGRIRRALMAVQAVLGPHASLTRFSDAGHVTAPLVVSVLRQAAHD